MGSHRLAAAPLLVLGLSLACLAPSDAAPRLSEPARWLQGYLKIDTTNPPGGEHRAAAYLGDILHREGIPTRLYVTPSGRTSLYARLPATGEPRQGALVLTHHMDVVPPGPGWSVPPFAAEVRDGRLWGRGAVDAKALGIAQLAAFVDLARRKAELSRDVIFLAVADEETGSHQGMAWLFENHPEIFSGVDGVLNEGGSNRVVNERILWWEVEVAQKRPLWLEVRTGGRAGHASGHYPNSAVHKLLTALARVVELPRTYRVTPPVREYLARLAPLHPGRYSEIFTHIDDYVEPAGPTVALMPGIANLFLDTVQVTVVETTDSINVIPAEARAQIDARLLPDTDGEAFLASLRETLGEEVEVEVLLDPPPSPPSPTSTPLYQAVAEVLGESAPVVPSVIAGTTDSRLFRQRGIPAYGIMPFALEYADRSGIHAADERIPLAELDRGVARMLRIVERSCLRAE